MMKDGHMLKVSMFCGGRGCATLIRELLRLPDIQLNLLVNAYDNGSSTGEMRRFIPGYLGPSDFRKNLMYLLELHSQEQYSLSRLLDYRFPDDFSEHDIQHFTEYLENSSLTHNIPFEMTNEFHQIRPALQKKIFEYISSFFEYYKQKQTKTLNLKNCSLGNIIFAGAFFINERDFEKATHDLMNVFQSKINVKLLNITKGENRYLVGLKQNGEFLSDESDIVEKQHESKYQGLYLIEQELPKDKIDEIKRLNFPDKKKLLNQLDSPVQISDIAKASIESSDIIIFGPGTQHSSLFPSYKTKGVKEAILKSQAAVKVLVMNIAEDHDTQKYAAEDIIDSALMYLGDKDNASGLITHVLYTKHDHENGKIFLRGELAADSGQYKNIRLVEGNFEHPTAKGRHNGSKTIRQILDIYDSIKKVELNECEVYMDLNQRAAAIPFIIEEFLELDWKERFSKVRLYINNAEFNKIDLPDNIEIKTTKSAELFSEVDFFKEWFFNRKSKYLVTITGDGEYRMADILNSMNVLSNSHFGAVYGSRNQSRKQFLHSLNAAYGESWGMSMISQLGAIFLSVLFALRFRIILSDPMTGFRVYNRSVLKENLKTIHQHLNVKTPLTLTRHLMNNDIEIAEIPVRYRTFKGFTNVKWRFFRGLKNLSGIIS